MSPWTVYDSVAGNCKLIMPMTPAHQTPPMEKLAEDRSGCGISYSEAAVQLVPVDPESTRWPFAHQGIIELKVIDAALIDRSIRQFIGQTIVGARNMCD